MAKYSDPSRSEVSEIQALYNYDIPALLESLPSDCFHDEEFFQEGGLWRFDFRCNFMRGRFYVSTVHRSPKEAFMVGREKILKQIQAWRDTRFTSEDSADQKAFADAGNPRVLLIDDDEDFVMGTIAAFNKVGWHTDVAVKHEELHRKIVNNDYDCILLDWTLNDSVTGDLVVERAVRLIDAFSDLQEKFSDHRPRLVTFSATDRDQIKLPEAGKDYFDYAGHWKKPMPFAEVVARAKKWL